MVGSQDYLHLHSYWQQVSQEKLRRVAYITDLFILHIIYWDELGKNEGIPAKIFTTTPLEKNHMASKSLKRGFSSPESPKFIWPTALF